MIRPRAPLSAAPAIELHDVSKRFGARWALARLEYTLPQGASLLLTGHNGSGKTTLLRLVSTVTAPTLGSLKILGLDARAERTKVREQVTLLSHANFHYEDLTAKQNLELVARLRGEPGMPEQVDGLLEKVGLKARVDSPVRQFSAGMRKRLAVARMLLLRPKLALLDEPFGELDPQGIAQMEAVMAELKAQGTTLVLATHLLEQGKRLTDVSLHLENGRQVA